MRDAGFTKIPNAVAKLLKEKRVSPFDLAVYFILRAHENGNKEAWPSQSTVASWLSCARETVNRSINCLIAAGMVWVSGGPGRSKIYHFGHPTCDPQITTTCDPQITTDVIHRSHRRRPIEEDTNEEDTKSERKAFAAATLCVAASAAPKPGPAVCAPSKESQMKKPRKKKYPTDPVVIAQAIDALDITKQRNKYCPLGVDVDALFSEFREACISGSAKNPTPNPYEYVNFSLGFSNWCSRSYKNPNGARKPIIPKHECPWLED